MIEDGGEWILKIPYKQKHRCYPPYVNEQEVATNSRWQCNCGEIWVYRGQDYFDEIDYTTSSIYKSTKLRQFLFWKIKTAAYSN